MDKFKSGAFRTRLSLVAALLFASLCATVAAGAQVAPISAGVRAFDDPFTTKYELFNAPAGITHAGGVMNWFYNDSNRPAAISKAAVIAQIQASQAKWSAVCKITFVYKGETTIGFSLPASGADGVNVIGWDPTGISAPTTGITYVSWNSSNIIVDAEIHLNAAYSATYSPASNFDATLTHETGHSLGLDHSDIQGQVMSGPPLTSYDGATVLGFDDIAGCVHLYGAAGSAGPAPDTQAPSVPTGLTAATFGTTQVNLSWNASTDNVGVTGYKIFQGGNLLGTVTGTGAAVTGLSPGTTYGFTVSACDLAGNCSAQSGSVSGTTVAADTQAPTVPTGLAATPFSTSQINLAWNASTDNVGVTSYKVFQGGVQLGTASGTSASATGLQAGTLYSFTVSACDAAGNCSAQSTSASAMTLAAPTCSGTQPPNDSQVLACPAGQTGSITQTRSYSCVGGTWTPGVFQTVSNTCTGTLTTPVSYQDMWWAGQQENGWGLTITQHQDELFLALYIYDSSGNPLWVVLPSGQWNAAHTTYTGSLYIPSGSWLGNYQVGSYTANASVGSASLAFSSTSTGILTYTVNGVSGTKAISRMAFGVVNTTPITDYMDMWWGGTAQNGWGIVLTQQYHNIFAAWFTYDTSGRTTWLVMPNGTWTGNTYSGPLYRTQGTPVLGATYNAAALVVTQAGTLSVTFADANTATMTYTVDGLTQTKAITRLPF